VTFAGAASERPTSVSDPTPANSRYKNRVSELWFSGKELFRGGQLRGITGDTIREMTARTYITHKTTKNDEGLLFEVEPKKDMKNRVGFSPDLADSLFILVELARERFGFGPAVATVASSERGREWKQHIRQLGGKSASASLHRPMSETPRLQRSMSGGAMRRRLVR
jgi:hypothetical protein